MKITKEHLGKRLLIRKNVGYRPEPIEVELREVSPSGEYLKIQFVRSDDTAYADWVNVDSYYLVEVLASKAEQISDIYNDFKKQSGPFFTVTSEEYEKESQKAHEKELKKNKWVHGICNPPMNDSEARRIRKECKF